MAVGFLEPCGMNTPHTHPRVTEIQCNVNGTIRTGMITENGGRFIMTDLQPGGMTIFPQGSIHFQINEGCDATGLVRRGIQQRGPPACSRWRNGSSVSLPTSSRPLSVTSVLKRCTASTPW
ncbi:RmlC-like cupin domain-containing protein [Mycena olivaceomarginata]|nr:RmlC-like cupin domain-containing protein [Mycena olivaceomarginata]